ncbi:unnamed protein product, partial [Ectocarpus sp. 13 AM-2016]
GFERGGSDGVRHERPRDGRVLHRSGSSHARRQRHLLHRRVRQDGHRGPGGHPRGDGAADDLHHQGRHPGHPQRSDVHPRRGQPPVRPLRPLQDPEGERADQRAHHEPLRPVFRGAGRVRRDRGLQHRAAHHPRPPEQGGGVAGPGPSLHGDANAALHPLRSEAQPSHHPGGAKDDGGVLPGPQGERLCRPQQGRCVWFLG